MGWKNLDGTVIAISGNRSVTTDGLQWILRRRTGTDRRTGKPVWESVSFVRSTNDILARCMRGREKAIGRAWGAFFAPAGGQPLPRSPKMPSQRTASPISSCFMRADDTEFVALSRRKQGFESPRERKRNQILTTFMSFGVQRLSNKRSWTAMDIKTHRSAFQARW